MTFVFQHDNAIRLEISVVQMKKNTFEPFTSIILACEQAPVGDSRVQSRANGMNRERSGEEGVCRGACRHSIDAAVP